jgi:tetratricopeptide (TPR) repeat protein
MSRLPAIAVVCTLLATPVLYGQDYDDLYRDAISHVRQREWQLAEQKLNQARKIGPPSGRNVIRRGLMGRSDYFPEFYLAVVYLNTGRAAEALPLFQAARQRGLNPRDSEFRQIGELESRANAIIEAEKRNAVPTGPTPQEQFKNSFGNAQRLFAEGRLDDAEAAARQARAFNVDNAAADGLLAKISSARATSRFQADLKRARTLADLRKLIDEYENTGINLDDVRRRITDGEAVETRSRFERVGMIEYYTGNYQKALAAIADAEKSAPLSARGNFYRACILASLATRGKTINQGQLREARRFYELAAKQPDVFKADLRFVSPRILELLKG